MSKFKGYRKLLRCFASMDNDDIGIGIDEIDLEIQKSSALLGEASALQNIIGSKGYLERASTDKSFMNNLRNSRPSFYKIFKKYSDKYAKIKDKLEDDKKLKLAKVAANVDTIQKAGKALSSAMEEPASSFLSAVFDLLTERKINSSKIDLLKDDEGYSIADDLAEVTGDPEIVEKETGSKVSDKVKENPGTFSMPTFKSENIEYNESDMESPTSSRSSVSTSGSSDYDIDELSSMECNSEEDIRELAEGMAHIAFGDKYDQDIVDDILENKIFPLDDINAMASAVKNIYRSAFDKKNQ